MRVAPPRPQDLLDKARVSPRQISIVITNSSLFNTTPSLSAAIMNHFKLPSRTVNYNLGGMGCSGGGGTDWPFVRGGGGHGLLRWEWGWGGVGWPGGGASGRAGSPKTPVSNGASRAAATHCLLPPGSPPHTHRRCHLSPTHACTLTAAGVVAVDLGRQLLQVYPNTYVLVVSHENLTSNWWVTGWWVDQRLVGSPEKRGGRVDRAEICACAGGDAVGLIPRPAGRVAQE